MSTNLSQNKNMNFTYLKKNKLILRSLGGQQINRKYVLSYELLFYKEKFQLKFAYFPISLLYYV